MSYEHTQKAPLGSLLIGGGIVVALAAWVLRVPEGPIGAVPAIVAAALVFTGLCFGRLTVRDGGDALEVRFGPLPLFGTRIPYAAVERAEVSRSDLLDGWGLHWLPGRGVIYNLWGFGCVRIVLGKKTVRVGTDDPEALAAFLSSRIVPGTFVPG